MGGAITVESQLGVGSAFTLVVPQTPLETPPQDGAHPEHSLTTDRKTIKEINLFNASSFE
jgi:hypothetical protein